MHVATTAGAYAGLRSIGRALEAAVGVSWRKGYAASAAYAGEIGANTSAIFARFGLGSFRRIKGVAARAWQHWHFSISWYIGVTLLATPCRIYAVGAAHATTFLVKRPSASCPTTRRAFFLASARACFVCMCATDLALNFSSAKCAAIFLPCARLFVLLLQ